jgi:hypothetical protein
MNKINEMDCLEFCIRGMNKKLIDFSSTEEGRNSLKFIKHMGSTSIERIREYVVLYNSVFLAQAMAESIGISLNAHTAWTLMNAPSFNTFHKELIETINRNFEMLMSKLTRKQRRKLEALVA